MYTRGLLPLAASKAEVGSGSCIQAGAPQEPSNWDGATRAGDGTGLERGSPPPSCTGVPSWLQDVAEQSPGCAPCLAEAVGDSCPALPQPGNILGMWQLPTVLLVNPGLA